MTEEYDLKRLCHISMTTGASGIEVSISSSDNKDTLEDMKNMAEYLLDKYNKPR